MNENLRKMRASSASPANDEGPGTKIRLKVGDSVATATLMDNETAQDFASLLPVSLDMHDLFGREKPGRLPRALTDSDDHQLSYEVGDVSYWPPAHDLAIFYADDGKSIPSPGLIPLGRIDSGLDLIASAGDAFRMTIERID
jgi:hypothetical protein